MKSKGISIFTAVLLLTGAGCHSIQSAGAVAVVTISAPLWVPYTLHGTRRPYVQRDPQNGLGQLQVFPDQTSLLFAEATAMRTTLLRLNISSSEILELTPGMLFAEQSAISPDGTSVAFVALEPDGESQIWAVRADGLGLRQLTYGPDDAAEPAWSPDSNILVYMSIRDKREADLSIVCTDGTGQRRITNDRRTHDMHPQFSLSGDKVIFARASRQRSVSVSNAERWRRIDVHSVSIASGSAETCRNLDWFHMDRFTLNAEGDTIRWPSGRYLKLGAEPPKPGFILAGTTLAWLESSGPTDAWITAAYASRAKTAAFTLNERTSGNLYKGSVFTIRSDGASVHELPGSWPFISNISMSPDGESVAFTTTQYIRVRDCDRAGSVVHNIYHHAVCTGQTKLLLTRYGASD